MMWIMQLEDEGLLVLVVMMRWCGTRWISHEKCYCYFSTMRKWSVLLAINYACVNTYFADDPIYGVSLNLFKYLSIKIHQKKSVTYDIWHGHVSHVLMLYCVIPIHGSTKCCTVFRMHTFVQPNRRRVHSIHHLFALNTQKKCSLDTKLNTLP